MAWGGSAPNKTYTRTDGVRSGAAICVTARTNGVNDTAELADVREQDLATAINLCWLRDGGNQPAANLPMNGYKFTGVDVAAARDEFARASQVQDGAFTYAGTAGGTADLLSLTVSPAITAYAAGQLYIFEAGSADNTGATNLNINSVGEVNLFKFDGATELAPGDIQAGGMYAIACKDGADFVLVGALPASLSPLIPLTPAADRYAYYTSATAAALGTLTAAGRALLDDADAAAQRTTLGLGTMAVETATTYLTKADNLASVANAATSFGNIKQAASDTATGVVEIADATEMEAGTDVLKAVTPGRQHSHPSAAKAWGRINYSGGTPTLAASYNITGIADTGTGLCTVTIATDFSSANYAINVTLEQGAAWGQYNTVAAGSIVLRSQDVGGSNLDPNNMSFAMFGDQ